MKKKYTTPTSTAISVRTTLLQTASTNTYGNNEGNIRFSTTSVEADDAD